MEEKKNIYDPADITCPQCQESFDSEARIPVVGCCGHWLCSVCVCEKKTTSCPVCKKEGGFPFSRRAATEQEKEPETENMSAPLESEVSPILKPENLLFLSQILNQLDPCSFVRFARTCKTIHDFCFKSEEIKVTYEIPSYYCFTYEDELRIGCQNAFLNSAEGREKLKNYPFKFTVKNLTINEEYYLGDDHFSQIYSVLSEFPITSISEVSVERIYDWESFFQFVKDFHTTDVRIWFGHNAIYLLLVVDIEALQELDEILTIPEEVATYLLQNTVRFESDVRTTDTTVRLVLNSSVQRLNLKKAYISQEMFVELIKRFAHSTDEIQWQLGKQQFDFGHYNIFNLHNPLHNEEDGPEERPAVAVDDNDPFSFWILRKDGSRVKCYQNETDIVFSTQKFDFESDPDYNPYESELASLADRSDIDSGDEW